MKPTKNQVRRTDVREHLQVVCVANKLLRENKYTLSPPLCLPPSPTFLIYSSAPVRTRIQPPLNRTQKHLPNPR